MYHDLIQKHEELQSTYSEYQKEVNRSALENVDKLVGVQSELQKLTREHEWLKKQYRALEVEHQTLPDFLHY